MKNKIVYRKNNYLASEHRVRGFLHIHPILMDGLKYIARHERRSISWVLETALADYLGMEVELKKVTRQPRPAKLQTYDRTGEIYTNNNKKRIK